MKRRLSILTPDSHTPNAPANRRGIVEAVVLSVLRSGGMLVRGDNGRTYITDENGQAVSEVKQ